MSKRPKKSRIPSNITGVTRVKPIGIRRDESLPGSGEIHRKQKFRTGGHLIDNILKSTPAQNRQLNIFDVLNETTQKKIVTSGANIELINRRGEGIHISKGEYRLLLTLSKIIHDKSEHSNPGDKNYYTGNHGINIMRYETTEGEIDVKYPVISFTLYEITKEFYGGDTYPSGKNIKDVTQLILNLADDPDKKALIKYKRKYQLEGNKYRELFIEQYVSLLQISTAGYTDFLDDKKIDERREVVVNLHPVFIDQIEDKYIELPLDITKRMIEANGGPNISEITTKLISELARALSNRKTLEKDNNSNPVYKIGKNKLYWKVAPNYMNEKTGRAKRPKLIEEYLTKAIETAISIGILLEHSVTTGATGELLLQFTLSPNWE